MKSLLLFLLVSVSLAAFSQTEKLHKGNYAFKDSVKHYKQVQYQGNYGSSFNIRSLIDRGYEDSARNKARDSVVALLGLKVDTLYRTSGKDSIQFTIGGRYHAIKDSTGGGGGTTLVKPGNADYTASAVDQSIVFETTLTADRTLTIPTATGNTGIKITVSNAQTATFLVLLSSTSSILYQGLSVTRVSKGDWITLMSDGTSWYVIASNGRIGSGVFTLKSAGLQSALPNSASTQVTAFDLALPANTLMKAGDKIVMYVWYKATGGGSDNITLNFRSGTANIISVSSTSFSATGNYFQVELVYQGSTSTDLFRNLQTSGGFPSLIWGATSSLIDWTAANTLNVLFTTGATTTITPVTINYTIYKE